MIKNALCIQKQDFRNLIADLQGSEVTTFTITEGEESLPLKIFRMSGRRLEMFNRLSRTLQPRSHCETADDLLQVIPYVTVIDSDDRILMYTRGDKGEESRLHGKRSIGFGGHVEEQSTDALMSIINRTMAIEMHEELSLDISGSNIRHMDESSDTVFMMFYDHGVNSYHLAIHYLIGAEESDIGEEEKDVINLPLFVSLSDMEIMHDLKQICLESWSYGIMRFMIESWYGRTQ